MRFFDFHHHCLNKSAGIYNLNVDENPPKNYFSAGIHPSLSAEVTDQQFVWLQEIAGHQNCLAIGECGLDGLINVDEKTQEQIFQRQIDLANELNKPLIIHCVRRFPQLIRFQRQTKVPLIVHGFNKRKIIGDELQNHNFYLSFGKSVLQNVNLQQFVKGFPIEKLFLETDDSDFDIQLLYLKVAELKNIELENLLEQIEENLKIFNIPHL